MTFPQFQHLVHKRPILFNSPQSLSVSGRKALFHKIHSPYYYDKYRVLNSVIYSLYPDFTDYTMCKIFCNC